MFETQKQQMVFACLVRLFRLVSFSSFSVFLSFFLLFSPFHFSLISSLQAAEGVMDYHPDAPLALGRSVNASFPLQEYRRCLVSGTSKPIDTQGSMTTDFTLSMITQSRELYRKLGVSFALSAHSLLSKVVDLNFDLSSDSEYIVKSDEVVFLLKGESDYGRFEWSDYELRDEYKKLLDEGKIQDFITRCGTHFVIREKRKSLVAAIIRIKGLSEEEKRNLTAKFSAKLPGASSAPLAFGMKTLTVPLSYSIKSNMNSVASTSGDGATGQLQMTLKELSKTNHISLDFYARGGGGLSELSGLAQLIGKGEGVEILVKGLENYIKSFKAENSTPSQYYLAPMTLFGLPQIAIQRNEDALQVFYDRYLEGKDIWRKLVSLQSVAEPESELYQQLSEKMIEHKSALRKWWKLGHQCWESPQEQFASKIKEEESKQLQLNLKAFLGIDELSTDESCQKINLSERNFFPAMPWKEWRRLLAEQIGTPGTVRGPKTDEDYDVYGHQVEFVCKSSGSSCGLKPGRWFPGPYWRATVEFKAYLKMKNFSLNDLKFYRVNNYDQSKVLLTQVKALAPTKRSAQDTTFVHLALEVFDRDHNVDEYLKLNQSKDYEYFLKIGDKELRLGMPYKSGKHL